MHEGSSPFREAEDALPDAAGRDNRSTRPERRRWDYTAGTTALGTVTTEIAKYVPYVVKLCYAIAGVVAIVGAISVYIKMNNEEQDVKKSIMMMWAPASSWSPLHRHSRCSSASAAKPCPECTVTPGHWNIHVQGAANGLLNSWESKAGTSTGRQEPSVVPL